MNLFIYAIQVMVGMTVFYGLYHLLLRRETWFVLNRAYLLVTLAISLLLPLISWPDLTEVTPMQWMTTVEISENSKESISALVASAENSPWQITTILLAVYITGLLILLMRFITGIYHILRLRKSGRLVQFGNVTCYLSDQIQAPFSFFGFICLPDQHDYSEAELSEVIAHESTHANHLHSLDVLFLEILKILCWFNPLVYAYRRSLEEIHEYTADKSVLHSTPWEDYAQFLVRLQSKQQPPKLVHQLIYSPLKNRLLMMTRQPSTTYARFKYLSIIPALLLAMILYSFTSPDTPLVAEDISRADNALLAADLDQPLFPGCEKVLSAEQKMCTATKLSAYMAEYLVYPKSLKKEGLEGKVIAKFVVSSDGKVKDATIVKSLHADADLAVLNLVISMNEKVGHWTPATKEGKNVDAVMHLPVVFKLDEE